MQKTLSVILLIVWTSIMSYYIYDIYFEKHLKAKAFIDEIENLKIDSTTSFQYYSDTSVTSYKFWVGKYKIYLIDTKAKPFESSERQEVFVTNYEGKAVMNYDTKYHFNSLDSWESDYIRLMKYLKIKHLND